MKDIHSHILYNIDDGAKDIEESIELLNLAIKNGYTDIILTPHYRKRQNYVANNKEKRNKFNILKEEIKKRNMNINIYLGNEITVDLDLFYYLNTNQVLSLNNSRYLLLELPFNGRINNLDKMLSVLMKNNIIPIIPHPERYNDYNEKDFIKWNQKGILFQGNIESLYGSYGNNAKEKIESMLKHDLISFMGSDIHEINYPVYKRDIKSKLDSIVNDKEKVLDLLDRNIDKVIKNDLIKPSKKKIGLFN